MKNQTKLLKGVILLTFVLTLFSCRKEQIETVDTKEPYKVVDGRLVFNKIESFHALMKTAKDKSPEDFAIQMATIKGFVPLSSFKNNAPIASTPNILVSQIRSNGVRNNSIDPYDGLPMDSPTSNDEYDDEIVMDPHLRSVINANREIQIEELIVRITETGVLFYEDWMSSRVDQLESVGTNFASYINESLFNDYEFRSANIEEHIAVIIPPRYHNEGMMSMSMPEKKDCRDCIKSNAPQTFFTSNCTQTRVWNWFGEKTTCTINYAHRRRARGVVWSQNVIIYSSAGVDTRNQRRVLGAWWKASTSFIALQAKGKIAMDIATAGGPSIVAFYPYDYPYESNSTGARKISKPILQNFGSATVCIPINGSTPKCKSWKLGEKYKIKKNDSYHEVQWGGITAKMYLSFED